MSVLKRPFYLSTLDIHKHRKHQYKIVPFPENATLRNLKIQKLANILEFHLSCFLVCQISCFSEVVIFPSAPLLVRHLWPWRTQDVCPITVGCTLHRLVPKNAGQMVVDDMVALLSPRQLV